MALVMTLHKYPRTPHLPGSPGRSDDDLSLSSIARLTGQEIVITEKMDGENTTLLSDRVHARSLDSAHHPSRAWVKALGARVGPQLPPGWRLCGENLFARHSLAYAELPSYLLLFSVWGADNRCLSWSETEEWAALLGLSTVPVLYRGLGSAELLTDFWRRLRLDRQEGFVVRTAAGFAYADFGLCVSKWVRAQHVQTDAHWMTAPVVPNRLAAGGGR